MLYFYLTRLSRKPQAEDHTKDNTVVITITVYFFREYFYVWGLQNWMGRKKNKAVCAV
jgi:hypothetical protein